jgi:hypothetical protein
VATSASDRGTALANGNLTGYQQQYGTTNVGGGFFGSGAPANVTLGQSGYNQQQYGTNNPGLNSNAFNGYQASLANAANVNASGGSPYSAAQLGLMQQLMGQANGTGGPSLADQQLQQGQQSALASTLAQTAGSRGMQNPGAADKMAQQNQAMQTQAGASQAAGQRAQEQLTAQQGLAGLTNQGLSQAATQAGLTQQAALANQGALNSAGQFNSGSAQNLANLQNQNWQYGTGLNAQSNNAYNQAVYGLVSGNQQQSSQLGNSIASSFFSPQSYNALSSDEDVKQNIENSNNEMRAFLASLGGGSGYGVASPLPLLVPQAVAKQQKDKSPEQAQPTAGIGTPGYNSGGFNASMGPQMEGADPATAGANIGATDLPGAAGLGEGGAAADSGAITADAGGSGIMGGGLMGGTALGGSDLGLVAAAAKDGGKNPKKQKVLVGEEGPELVTFRSNPDAGDSFDAKGNPTFADPNRQALYDSLSLLSAQADTPENKAKVKKIPAAPQLATYRAQPDASDSYDAGGNPAFADPNRQALYDAQSQIAPAQPYERVGQAQPRPAPPDPGLTPSYAQMASNGEMQVVPYSANGMITGITPPGQRMPSMPLVSQDNQIYPDMPSLDDIPRMAMGGVVGALRSQTGTGRMQDDEPGTVPPRAMARGGVVGDSQQGSDRPMAMAGGGIVGLNGPEIRELPKGAVVTPSPQTMGLLRSLQGADHSYQYKDPNAPGAAPGTHFGPMAQELEKSAVGRSVVQQGPDGHKMVDTQRLTMALASGLGELNKQVMDLRAGLEAIRKTKKRAA